jgi:hypothetical protein
VGVALLQRCAAIGCHQSFQTTIQKE